MSRTPRGFTLVEVLIALSVSALLISLVYGVVVLSQRSVQAIEQRAVSTETMHIGWRFLHDALTNTQSVSDPRDEDNSAGFDGTTDRLSFVADQPAFLGPGGLTRIAIEVRDEDGIDALVITREPFDPGRDDDLEAPAKQAVLVNDLKALKIRYFGANDESESMAWVDTWQDTPYLPSLVEIQVTPRGESAWPVMIARPMASVALYDGELATDEEPEDEDPAAPDADDAGFDEPLLDEDLPIDART